MNNEILIALVAKMIEDRINDLQYIGGQRGPRGISGQPGLDGQAGRDFNFSEHENTIKEWTKEFALKFQDLSAEEIEKLRGPRGRDGRDFNFSEHENTIKEWTKEFALKFQDLSAQEIEQLRGPRGRDGNDGRDGQNFIFSEYKDEIECIIRATVGGMSEQLKLRFGDLSESDINDLRGPRGRDGRDGRDFVFDDHREFFNSLRLKFSDLTEEERTSLKLHFSELSEEEKSSLKLKFKDLTDEDLALIRGPRGLRGQRGSAGRDGKDGAMGVRGLPGVRGISGLPGVAGKDGVNGNDGADAPHIVQIYIDEIDDDIIFNFEFSDGTVIRSDRVTLPKSVITLGGGGARGKKQMNYETHIDEVSDSLTYVGKALPGNDTDEAVWQVQKITVTGTETIIEFADGNDTFDNIWDDRATLTYF